MLFGHAEHTKLRIKIIREILICNNDLATIGGPDDASTIRKRMQYKVTDIILIQLYFKELLRLLIPKDDIVLPKFLSCGIHLGTAEAASTLSNHNIRNGRIRCLKVLNVMETDDLLHLCNYHHTLPQISDFKILRIMIEKAFKRKH